MLTPAEEQALQAAQLAQTLPPGTSTTGQTPEQIRTMQETQAQIAADQAAPQSGMVMNPTTGLPMPTEMTQVTSPVQNVTQATKQLDPLAKEANEKVEAARKAYTEAANMTIPAEKVQPYMDPQEFAAMAAAGKTTVNAGEFADIQGRYQAKLVAEADAKEKADQARRDQEREARMRQSMAEAESRWSEVAKKASPSEMFAEPSIGAKIGQAIALGLSTYAHIRMGHSGPSPVQMMIQQQLDRDYAQRRAALQASVEAAEKAGAKPAQILAMMKQEDEAQKERRITQQKWIANQADNMAKAFPTKDREARMIQAQYEQKAAEESLKLFADKLTEEKRVEDEGRKVVHTTTERPEAEQPKGNWSALEAQQEGLERNRAMENIASLVEKNPGAWKEFQAAYKSEMENEAAGNSSIGRVLQTARGAGFAPVAIDQRLKSPEARAINAAIAPLITAKAREMDPIGALNKDAYVNASKSLNIVTAPPRELAAKAREYGAIAARKAEAAATLAPKPRVMAPEAAAGAPAAKPAKAASKPRKLRMSAEDEAAKEWLKANPNHPKAKAVRARIMNNAVGGE